MFCEKCGKPLPEGAVFCEACGTRAAAEAVPEELTELPVIEEEGTAPVMEDVPDEPAEEDIGDEMVTENIRLCADGRYRWTYEFQMLKNPAILITVLKVMLLSYAIVIGLLTMLNLFDGSFRYWNSSDYRSFYGGFLILLAVLLVLSVIAYLVVAAVFGWSYQVLLTMDEKGVEIRQMDKDFEKAQAIGWLTAAVGRSTGRIGMAGTGMLAAARKVSVSVFADVRKVKAVRRRHVIYVNQLLGHNQVYAEDADFDFVERFIKEHCVNAKIS